MPRECLQPEVAGLCEAGRVPRRSHELGETRDSVVRSGQWGDSDGTALHLPALLPAPSCDPPAAPRGVMTPGPALTPLRESAWAWAPFWFVTPAPVSPPARPGGWVPSHCCGKPGNQGRDAGWFPPGPASSPALGSQALTVLPAESSGWRLLGPCRSQAPSRAPPSHCLCMCPRWVSLEVV